MRQTTRRLVILKVSPWSERARWALDHHRLPYETIEHTPFLGERRLRRLVGADRKPATVPVLLTGEQALTDSWDIALHADRVGEGPKLIPPDREAEIRRWNDLADGSMAAGRALVLSALLANPEALDEGLPPNVPAWLRPLLRPMGRHGMRWFARKYGLDLGDAPARVARVRSTLEMLRDALSKSSPYLLGSFSYADIVMAICLQGVSPVDDRYIPLGPATRRAWTLDALAAEFADLVAWRDQLYGRHRDGSPVRLQR
jgi:glutathione S-transferase